MQRMLYFSQAASRVNFFPVYGFPVFISNVDLFWSQSDRTEFCGKTIFFVQSFFLYFYLQHDKMSRDG